MAENFMYEYKDTEENAQPEVKKAIERFKKLSEEEKSKKPLLYWLLGKGTPKFKISQEDSEYTDKAKGEQNCGNCEFLYLKNSNGKYICSQIRGRVEKEGWCNRWKKQK